MEEEIICEYCQNTGIIVPSKSLSLEELEEVSKTYYCIGCFHCESVPNFDLYLKYFIHLFTVKAAEHLARLLVKEIKNEM